MVKIRRHLLLDTNKSTSKGSFAFNVIVTIMDMIEHRVHSHTIIEKKFMRPHGVIK